MPTAKSIDAAANNRSAKSWFSHSKYGSERIAIISSIVLLVSFVRPTFNDVSSILRSTVHRLTTGGVTFRTGDPRSHRCVLSHLLRRLLLTICLCWQGVPERVRPGIGRTRASARRRRVRCTPCSHRLRRWYVPLVCFLLMALNLSPLSTRFDHASLRR